MESTADELCINILDKGTTASEFMDREIKNRSTTGPKDSFFVANLDLVVKQYFFWRSNLPRVTPFFAVKCNNTPALLWMLSTLGTGFDCASQSEIEEVLSHGVEPSKIIFAHTCKPESHIKYARTCGVQKMTFDSQSELAKIARCYPTAKLVLRIEVDDSKATMKFKAKFGASLATVPQLLEQAGKLGMDVIGVSFHVGSGCNDSSAFRSAIADARSAFNIANDLGFQMSLLDIGGGFRGRADYKMLFKEIVAEINSALDEFFPPDCGVTVIAEPGRYFGEPLFTLAMNVIGKKIIRASIKQKNGRFSSFKKKMMYYVNDGMHHSLGFLPFDAVQSKVTPYPHKTFDEGEQRYQSVIWGQTCNGNDKISDDCSLPELHVGDWLLLDNVGAYSAALSSTFNGFETADVLCVVTSDVWQDFQKNIY